MTKKMFYPLMLLMSLLIGTILSDQVDWGILDFLIMGAILLFVGIAISLVSQKTKHPRKRLFYNFVILLIFFLLWTELAVGIF
jgi:hypothetical protein